MFFLKESFRTEAGKFFTRKVTLFALSGRPSVARSVDEARVSKQAKVFSYTRFVFAYGSAQRENNG